MALWKARSESVPPGQSRHAPTSTARAPLSSGGVRPVMGGIPTPVVSPAAGIAPPILYVASPVSLIP